jgi:hypothetical protein
MGFGGHVTIDTVGSPEPLYQNVKGEDRAEAIDTCHVTADPDNGGNIMIGPFQEVSASAPRYGTMLLAKGHTVRIRSDAGVLVNLREWWVDGDNATDTLWWSVIRGARTEAEGTGA